MQIRRYNKFNSDRSSDSLIITMRESGYSYSQIADVTSLDIRTVKKVVSSRRPDLANTSWNNNRNQKIDLPVDQMVKLRKMGYTKKQLSHIFGCCEDTIKNRLRDHSDSTGENLSGYIKPTIRYPEEYINRLRAKGYSVYDFALENGSSVVDVIYSLNRKKVGSK